jgi:hypothetical protein
MAKAREVRALADTVEAVVIREQGYFEQAGEVEAWLQWARHHADNLLIIRR